MRNLLRLAPVALLLAAVWPSPGLAQIAPSRWEDWVPPDDEVVAVEDPGPFVSPDMDRPEKWIEDSVWQWLAWPSEEEVEARKPIDRHELYPGVQTEGGLYTTFPAVTARRAKYNVVFTLRVLATDWYLDDFSPWMVALQMPDPSESLVLCRYALRGWSFHQIHRLTYSVIVIVPPEEAVAGLSRAELGMYVLRTVFYLPDEYLTTARLEVVLDTESASWYRTWYSPSRTGNLPTLWSGKWCGRARWGTDGRAFILLLSQAESGNGTIIPHDNPWF